MTDADRESLRVWAESHAPVGSTQARRVLALLADLDAQKKLNVALGERIAGLVEILAKRAERA